jgi:hypothetical protein
MQQVTASQHLRSGPGWLTPSSLVHILQYDSGPCCKLKVKYCIVGFSAAFHVLSCTLAFHVNRLSVAFFMIAQLVARLAKVWAATVQFPPR